MKKTRSKKSRDTVPLKKPKNFLNIVVKIIYSIFYCIAGYALSRVIHFIQYEIIFHANPNLYIEWLGTVERQYPPYHLDPKIVRCGNGDQTIRP